MLTTIHPTRVNTPLARQGVNHVNLPVNVQGTGSPALSLTLVSSYRHQVNLVNLFLRVIYFIPLDWPIHEYL